MPGRWSWIGVARGPGPELRRGSPADGLTVKLTERLEPMISERRIRARTTALARRIEGDYHGKALSLVVVLKGAVIFAADLMRQLTVPCTIDFIAAASYGGGTRSSGNVALSGLARLAIGGRHV